MSFNNDTYMNYETKKVNQLLGLIITEAPALLALENVSLENAQSRALKLQSQLENYDELVDSEAEDEEEESTNDFREDETKIYNGLIKVVGFNSVCLTFHSQNTTPILAMMKNSLKRDQEIIYTWLPFMLPINSVKHSKIKFNKKAEICLYDKHFWDIDETSYDKDAKPTKSILKSSSTFTMLEVEHFSDDDINQKLRQKSWSSSISKGAKKYAKKAHDLTFGSIAAHRRATKERCNSFVSNAVIQSAYFSQ